MLRKIVTEMVIMQKNVTKQIYLLSFKIFFLHLTTRIPPNFPITRSRM